MDTSAQYLGLTLRTPVVASSCPLTATLSGISRLEAAGVGAVVLPSLFEEQIQTDAQRAEEYLDLVAKAAGTVDVPIIGSLNGTWPGAWTDFAAAVESAGASAIELNVYYLPGDPLIPARDAERRYTEILTTVKAVVSIPVSVKMPPFFSSAGEMAVVLDHAGADGLVLFNRFLQADIDPETFTVSSGFKLSTPAEGSLSRAWITRLRGDNLVRCSLAGSTGVEQWPDVAAYLLAGADVVMAASALLRHGPDHVGVLLSGLTEWLDRKGLASVEAARGLLARSAGGEPAYGRVGYISAIEQARHAYRAS